ncbi:serine/threonine-protein kinase [Caenimonas koreensis]|uniref:serine/threonine-protein kinase n=1 Tax=Caenimonas koreensis TaxID=367474 RepID=UPI003784A586
MSLKKLGRYDLIRVLGKGAMGIVYEGRDPNLDRRVAIKTVKVENLSEEAAAEYEHRFRTEARSAARLQHPNIVSVYDSDRDGDIAFLVMEYIQGDDLKHHIDKGVRYSLDQSLKMIRDLLSALDYAHKQGIVHRDIKPANLLIEPVGGRVKLTDFGVARIQDSGEATRTQGSMVGTLKYMSPEQVQGQKIDSRADLFSVGVVLYQLLTDKRPFDGDNDFSIIHQIIGHTPPAPTSFNPRLPAAIDAVVARALAKNRNDRFATARDFAAALQSAIRRAEDSTVVPPADPTRRSEGASNINPSIANSMMTSPSTVTQEVELVYWKDIKDSVEPEEFESFLAKFPAGIYADLARRRLRKLTGAATGADSTVLGGTPGALAQDLDATRLRTSPSAPLVVPAASPVPAVAPPAAEMQAGREGPPSESSTDFTRTIVEERQEAPATSSSADSTGSVTQVIAPPPPAQTPPPAPPSVAVPPPPPPSAPAPAPAREKPPLAVKQERDKRIAEVAPTKRAPVGVIAGVGAVAVAAVVAFMMMGKGAPPSPEVAAAASAASAAPASAAASAATPAASTPAVALVSSAAASAATAQASGASAPTSAPVTAASAAKAGASAGKASAARKAASAQKGASAASAPDTQRAPLPAQPPKEEVKPAPAPAPATVSPVDQCADKVFMSREFCLVEQCAKPGTSRHPLCIKHREDVRMREESKIR